MQVEVNQLFTLKENPEHLNVESFVCVNPAELFARLKKEGNEHFQAKRYEDAVVSYSQALDIKEISEKERAVLYSNRSVSILEQNPHDHSILLSAYEDAKQACYLWPSWSKAHYRAGSGAMALKKFRDAAERNTFLVFLTV